jgi:hypothetical protein
LYFLSVDWTGNDLAGSTVLLDDHVIVRVKIPDVHDAFIDAFCVIVHQDEHGQNNVHGFLSSEKVTGQRKNFFFNYIEKISRSTLKVVLQCSARLSPTLNDVQ